MTNRDTDIQRERQTDRQDRQTDADRQTDNADIQTGFGIIWKPSQSFPSTRFQKVFGRGEVKGEGRDAGVEMGREERGEERGGGEKN